MSAPNPAPPGNTERLYDRPDSVPLAEAATLPPSGPAPLAPPPAEPCRSPPGYEVLEELGRGGMGVVYKARQVSLNRTIALKMILVGGHAGEVERGRFRTEAEAIARLQHPNIVQIHEVGEHQGLPYFSLEFCAGGSLEAKLQGTPLPPHEAAALVEALARAAHAAHQKGVIHRDLKPANVLLTDDGTPKITDFGLAKKIGEAGQTATGVVMGTPSYMAPEQAGGKTREITPAADVYALGAILYHCLTGRPPFQAATPVETVMQVLDRVPAPPRVLNAAVPRDLETICLTCLQKDPRRRYASAALLADDLRRFRAGEPIAVGRNNVLSLIVGALEKASHTEAEFRSWGTMLMWFAAIILAGHLTTTVLMFTDQPRWIDWVSRGAQLLLGLLVFWRYRGGSLLPSSPAERLLAAIWGGYLTAYVTGALVNRLLLAQGMITRPEGASVWRDELLLYPYSAVLSGLGFVIMGSSYWGRYYVLGAAFFVLALLMSLRLEWAPLAFGLLWSASLAGIGLHLRHLAREETKHDCSRPRQQGV